MNDADVTDAADPGADDTRRLEITHEEAQRITAAAQSRLMRRRRRPGGRRPLTPKLSQRHNLMFRVMVAGLDTTQQKLLEALLEGAYLAYGFPDIVDGVVEPAELVDDEEPAPEELDDSLDDSLPF